MKYKRRRVTELPFAAAVDLDTIKPSELGAALRQANLELVNITGMTYNPFLRRYKLNPNDVDVNYLIHARKPAPA